MNIKIFRIILDKFILILFLLFIWQTSVADKKTVDLVVDYKTVHFSGKSVQAIAVNNQIPGPTLHFQEGDNVTINVYNHLMTGTTMHWHGIILPWKMDGVAYVTQPPIPPGGVFHYHFIIKQSGTYWYHAHADLQEQQGVYGGIIIDPPKQLLHYDQDFMVVLSDWSNTHPKKIYANLKKEGGYYAYYMPLQPTLLKFLRDYQNAKTPKARKKLIHAYKMMQHMRMSIYDFSDVAYDAYLLNGTTSAKPWTKHVNVGDVVRLRFVGAAAGTIYKVKIPDATMQLVQVDGQNVKVHYVPSLTIAPGETYDVLVNITNRYPYIIYAESSDTRGQAIGVLLTAEHQKINIDAVQPFPEPEPVMMGNHGSHNMYPMSHIPMKQEQSSSTRYDALTSLVPTNDPNLPVHEIHLTLSGFMERYMWFINGVPEYKAKPLMIKKGERYRLIFQNQTMMHHPMHLHGHWFILRNGHGAYDPLLHTIDVPPGATVIADVDANESGQWYFHCHMLYHMKAGMANIFRYEPVDMGVSSDVMQDQIYDGLNGHRHVNRYWVNEIDFNGDFFNHTYQSNIDIMYGADFNKLQLRSEDAEVEDSKIKEANVDVFYWHLINQFWALKGGANYVYRPSGTPYWQPGIGIEGLLPYFIQTDGRVYYHDGATKFDLELARDTQISNHFFIRLALRSIFATKTIDADEIGSGLNELEWTIRPYYQISPRASLYLQYQRKDYFGTLKNNLSREDEDVFENLYSIGISILF